MIQETILGAIIIDNSLFIEYNKELNEKYFTHENKIIYKSIEYLITNAYDATIDTIIKHCKDERANIDVLSTMINKGISCTDIGFELELLRDEYTRRVLEETNLGLHARIEHSKEVSEILTYMTNQMMKISTANERDKTISEVLSEINKRIEASRNNDISGVYTGFNNLNKLTSGWQGGELIIIAGRPAMGKTAFVTTAINNMSQRGIKCVLFSLEMSYEQIITRMLSFHNIPMSELRSGQLNDYSQYQYARTKVSELPVKIYDNTYTLKSIILKARELKMQGKCDVVIIDYLQLIINDKSGRNRENEVSEISRQLKLLAKDLDIPVICLSQLRRGVENRKDSIPKLSDLRESGAIEQDADIIGFLYRPEYYNIMEDEKGESTENKAYLLIEKNRNGSLANLEYYFYGKYTKFVEREIEENTF